MLGPATILGLADRCQNRDHWKPWHAVCRYVPGQDGVEVPRPGLRAPLRALVEDHVEVENLGGDALEKQFWLEFWFEKRIEIPF